MSIITDVSFSLVTGDIPTTLTALAKFAQRNPNVLDKVKLNGLTIRVYLDGLLKRENNVQGCYITSWLLKNVLASTRVVHLNGFLDKESKIPVYATFSKGRFYVLFEDQGEHFLATFLPGDLRDSANLHKFASKLAEKSRSSKLAHIRLKRKIRIAD